MYHLHDLQKICSRMQITHPTLPPHTRDVWPNTPRGQFEIAMHIVYINTDLNQIKTLYIHLYVALYVGRVKRIFVLSPMRAAKVQASLRIRAVSPEPPLLAHTSSEPRGTFRQKARSLAPLNGWACAVKICHDGMLEDTNSLDGAHVMYT